MKAQAREKIEKRFTGNGCLDRLAHEAMRFAEQEDLWEETRDAFFHNTVRIDGIRNEDLFRTFPELSPLEFDF
jgi:hypothetical protein